MFTKNFFHIFSFIILLASCGTDADEMEKNNNITYTLTKAQGQNSMYLLDFESKKKGDFASVNSCLKNNSGNGCDSTFSIDGAYEPETRKGQGFQVTIEVGTNIVTIQIKMGQPGNSCQLSKLTLEISRPDANSGFQVIDEKIEGNDSETCETF